MRTGKDPTEYSTSVIGNWTIDWLRQHVGDGGGGGAGGSGSGSGGGGGAAGTGAGSSSGGSSAGGGGGARAGYKPFHSGAARAGRCAQHAHQHAITHVL